MPLSMLLIVLSLTLGALCARHGGWGWLGIWLAIDFFVVGIAHARGWHRILGKRADGTLPLWSWLAFWPLLIYTQAVWQAIRWFSREPAWQEIAPGIVVGRRILGRESPGAFDNWLDLTAEFREPAPFRNLSGYLSLAILDGATLDPRCLADALDRLRPGTTFIHCAQGHGRTGLVCAALLLHRRLAPTAAAALAQLQSIRPGVRLNRQQLATLDQFEVLCQGNNLQ